MHRDESYILDLCDAIFAPHKALRQHRFDFLRGDKRGARPGDPPLVETGRRLPVDAFYPDLDLVIEYHECQHTEAVPFMDKRPTVSGVPRGEQRRIYDERRRRVLTELGIALVVLDYSDFRHGRNKRLLRDQRADLAVLRKSLAPHIRRPIPVSDDAHPDRAMAISTAVAKL